MTFLPVSLYDVPAQQAWLEDQAARGRFLEDYTGVLASFTTGEPKSVRYRLEPLTRREKAPAPDRRELYRELGWDYVTTIAGTFHIWRCDDPELPEMDTDPLVRAGAYDRLRRQLRWANWSMALILLALAALVLWLNLRFPDHIGWLTGQIRSQQPWWTLIPAAAAVFALCQLVHWNRTLHRLVRTLYAGIPAPQRGPYRLFRALSVLGCVLYAAFLAVQLVTLFQPNQRSFLPPEDLTEPVPCVALADAEGVWALPIENWRTTEQWWLLQGERNNAESRYYRLRFPWLPDLLTREITRIDGLQPLDAPGLTGAWWRQREDGLQTLLVRRDRQVLEISYRGREDLRSRLGDYAAILAEFQ